MKVAVVGTGYVGLVTGTCFADMGNEVTCVDIDAEKVERMRAGEVPIFEPGLEDVFRRNVREGRLDFTTDIQEAIGATAIFLALPTPPGEDGSADLSYILGVADELGKRLTDYTVVVNKSTVPVGTADKVRAAIGANAKTEFDVVSNPEFLREGQAVKDFLEPERVVIGTDSPRAEAVMRELYEPFVVRTGKIIVTDTLSSEMIKYAANAFLATKISFMNQIANLCAVVGADVGSVRQGIGSDSRIGDQFLYPGPGYGGSCFPKDVLALATTAEKAGYDFGIIKAVMEANDRQKQVIPNEVLRYFEDDVAGKTLAMWGLAFKDNTDDIRESPALDAVRILTEKGAKIIAFDPQAMDNVARQLKGNENLAFAKSDYDALTGADALIVMTNWREFKNPDFERMKELMKEPVIFDGRNMYSIKRMEERGFHYFSIGRKVVTRNAS